MPTWNPTQIEILETLGLKVRVLSDEQLATGWLSDAAATAEAEKLMQPLCEVGLVERREVYAHPLLEMNKPVVHKRPGDPLLTDEQVNQLAQYFSDRWGKEEQRFVCFIATRLGASYVGSHILDPPSHEQFSHDLHVAQLFVNFKQANESEAMRFVVGEGMLPKLGRVIARMKDPDLFVVDEHAQAKQIIEHAGSYPAEHIRDFDVHCSGEAHAKLVKRFPNRRYRLYPNPDGTEYLLY